MGTRIISLFLTISILSSFTVQAKDNPWENADIQFSMIPIFEDAG